MIKLQDQIGNELSYQNAPNRVVSLVPSMTELWVDMAGIDKLVGRTKFCIHPSPEIKKVQRIGGTKNPRVAEILELDPDLILANKEENNKQDILTLSEHVQVYTSNIKTVSDNVKMITDFEILLNKQAKGQVYMQLESTINDLKNKRQEENQSAIYLIWKNPYMAAGGDTFINDMMQLIGFNNLLDSVDRYPEITVEEIKKLNPEYILLSSEPYPFKDSDINELHTLGLKSKIICVDGEAFSWYGSRISKKTDTLRA